MLDSNWKPIVNWTNKWFTYKYVDWDWEWYSISASRVEEFWKDRENTIRFNYILPI